MTEDADIIIAAYGTTAHIAKKIHKGAARPRHKGRFAAPITLWPFPSGILCKGLRTCKMHAYRRDELQPDGGGCTPGRKRQMCRWISTDAWAAWCPPGAR